MNKTVTAIAAYFFLGAFVMCGMRTAGYVWPRSSIIKFVHYICIMDGEELSSCRPLTDEETKNLQRRNSAAER